MDPHDDPNRSPLLPLPVKPGQPEAFQRAPTLMAGETAGEQGLVRVWHPKPGENIRTYARTALVGLLIAGPLFLTPVLPSFVLVYAIFLMAVLLPWLGTFLTLCTPMALLKSTLWKPCYVSADESGMAVNSLSGTINLQWDEIVGCFQKDMLVEELFVLYTTSHGPVPMELWGFGREASRELTSIIRTRANLLPPQGRKNLFWPLSWCAVRPGWRVRLPGRAVQTDPPALRSGGREI